MARKIILGNDPFARGAAVRSTPEAAPLPFRPLAMARATRKPVSRVALQPKASVPRQGAKPRPAPRPVAPTALPAQLDPHVAPIAQPAPLRAPRPTRKPAPPSAAELAARDFLETAGARLRNLLERRLPALIEGLAKSSVDALGLTAQPVSVSDVDGFGMSPEFVRRWQPVLARVLKNYFRAEVLGLGNLPAHGPAILVCNHSGMLPYDELLLAVAVREGLGQTAGRELRPLSEDFAINSPFAGSWLNRLGLVRASQDNAERLLKLGQMVAAFPEGSQGIAKLYKHRYQLQRFGRGGFVRLALRTQVPIYPVAMIGGDESQPVLARVRLPRAVRLRHLPVTPTFPLLGPLGLVPLPSRWTIQVGERIALPERAADAENRPLVGQLTEQIRDQMQGMLNALVARRTSLFL